MENHREPMFDGISRTLSGLGLMLAIAACAGAFFLYQQNERLQSRIAELESAKDLSAEAVGSFESTATKLVGEWDQSVKDSLEKFKERSNEKFATFDDALADGTLAITQKLDEFDKQQEDIVAKVAKQVVAKPVLPEDSGSEPIGDRITLDSKAKKARIADLRIASAEEGTVIVENDGDTAIEIRSVSFDPKEFFESDLNALPTKIFRDDIVVRYLPTDNSAADKNQHGVYKREYLSEPLRVRPGTKARVIVEIENEKNRGYGFRGELILETADGQRLRISDAEANMVVDFSV